MSFAAHTIIQNEGLALIIIYDSKVNKTITIVYVCSKKNLRHSDDKCICIGFLTVYISLHLFFIRSDFSQANRKEFEKRNASKKSHLVVVTELVKSQSHQLIRSSRAEQSRQISFSSASCRVSESRMIKITHFINPHKFFFKRIEDGGKLIVNCYLFGE